tara:strand:+ start:213 stop:1070 length:858 start_codon:yes stop_codon:yes gene_type:complete
MIKLSKSQIKQFKDQGYLIFKSFYPKKRLDDALKWLKTRDPKKIAKSWTEKEPGVPIAVYSALGDKNTKVYRIASDKKVLDLASQLMSDKVYLWHSKVNFKERWGGTVEYYHQDQVYWKDRGYKSDKMLSCMIPLENHNQKNAGLKIFPKTHKLGFIKHDHFININGLCKFMINQKTLDKFYKKYKLVDIELQTGDILFFHSSLVHGSSHNSSPKSRSIILSQINTISNLPKKVQINAVKFNLKRSKIEFDEAKRRLRWFKKKYFDQKKSSKLTFSAPIPNEERK